jgi:protein SCO1/2
MKAYGRAGGEKGWHFLVGDEASIQKLTSQVGFKYRWDEEGKQWAHSAAAIVLTPGGEISRYLYGIMFDPQTVRLSLVEAAKGQVGSIVDRLILFCFHYDPKASKYTLYAMNVMRGGAVLIVLVLGAFLFPFWRRQRRAVQSLQGEV